MLRQRIITALILAPLMLGVIFWLPHEWTAAALAALVLGGAWEWSGLLGWRQPVARLGYVALVAAGLGAVWMTARQGLAFSWVLMAALVWWLVALAWIILAPARRSTLLCAVAGLLVLVPAWLALVSLHALTPQLVLFVLLLVVAADVGAYFAGRRFGRHKLAPQVSPGKTWQGVFGGMAGAALLSLGAVWWFEVPALPFLGLCLLVTAASVVGDLTESLFKRQAGLKDSGTLLPGHGGLLDRVDSITAAAPVFLAGLIWLELLP